MEHGGFVTAINRMDGRVQKPVFEYMGREYAVPYVDMITEPGPIKILEEQQQKDLVESVRARRVPWIKCPPGGMHKLCSVHESAKIQSRVKHFL